MNSLSYIHSDHLGSSSIATDVLGDLVANNTYFPYGEHRSSTGAFGTDRDFTGQRLESGTGLHFYNARYYDSALGRFISPDSLIPNPRDPRSYNRYSYVGNNPLRYTDPTGNCWGPLRDACESAKRTAGNAMNSAMTRVSRAKESTIQSALSGLGVASDFLLGENFEVQTFAVEGIKGEVSVLVVDPDSLLGSLLDGINGRGPSAIAPGFGPVDIISTTRFGVPETATLEAHEFQHVREIKEYGPGIWHSTYQIEQLYWLWQWFAGGFEGTFKDEVHNRIGKEQRAEDVAQNRRSAEEATDDAFPW